MTFGGDYGIMLYCKKVRGFSLKSNFHEIDKDEIHMIAVRRMEHGAYKGIGYSGTAVCHPE